MSNQSAERKKIRYYRYGPHVVQIVGTTGEDGNVNEELSVTRNGTKAAELRGGHGYARLPKVWRQRIREEVDQRG